MAYSQFDPTKPSDADTGTTFDDNARVNLNALRDAVIIGAMHGFVFSASGGTAAAPAFWLWKNGTTWLRATLTWGTTGGEDGNPTTIVWALSINSGSDYTTAPGGAIDTQTFAWDANGDLTATTGNGSVVSWLIGLLGKVKRLQDAFDAGVSGLYDPAAVAITGGTLANVAITAATVKGTPLGGTGATEAALATVTAVHTKVIPLTPASGGTATLDLNNDHFKITPAGNFTIALTNVPATAFSVSIILELVNCAGKTITLPAGGSWGAAGAPTFSANTDYVSVISSNGFSTSRFVFSSKG